MKTQEEIKQKIEFLQNELTMIDNYEEEFNSQQIIIMNTTLNAMILTLKWVLQGDTNENS